MAGRQATTIYSRKRRKSGISRDFHVREYTPVELREAVAAAGGEVIREGLFDWYGAPAFQLPHVSRRQAMMLVARKGLS
jgi:hypothetical protein